MAKIEKDKCRYCHRDAMPGKVVCIKHVQSKPKNIKNIRK